MIASGLGFRDSIVGRERRRRKQQMQECEEWRAASGFKLGRKGRKCVNGGRERVLEYCYCKSTFDIDSGGQHECGLIVRNVKSVGGQMNSIRPLDRLQIIRCVKYEYPIIYHIELP